MRTDLRLRLREIAKSVSTVKMGVTGVTGVTNEGGHPLSHLPVTPSGPEIDQQNQCVTPVTPCHTLESEGRIVRHTFEGVADVVAERVTVGGTDPEDWLAFYDERAGILEFDGGLDRADAERRALVATVAALGPRPRVH